MKSSFNGTQSIAITAAVLVFVTSAYWFTRMQQDEPAPESAKVASSAVPTAAPSGSAQQTTTAPAASGSLSSCNAASPFAKNTNCYKEPDSLANATGAMDMTNMEAAPTFENVHVVGLVGDGIAAKLLQSAGNRLSGSAGNNDAVLVDVSAASVVAPVETSIKRSLEEGKQVIVDGGDSKDSSKKVNEIMGNVDLMSIDGVSAYAVSKHKDGRYQVTPLQSVADANGKRQFDQLHQVLGVEKPKP